MITDHNSRSQNNILSNLHPSNDAKTTKGQGLL
jgi:hypothetical protein